MSTKLHSLILGLAIVVAVHSVVAQPSLGIVETNNQIILFWPAIGGGTNGVLQSANNLVSPNWLSATDALPVNYGSQIAVSVSNVSSVKLFRLSVVPPTADGMAMIAAGSFAIGDELDSEVNTSSTNVYVSAFYMDTNLVSLSQWQEVYTYATSQGYVIASAGSGDAANYPVEFVSWYDCVAWCNARSQQMDLKPVYYTDMELTQVFTNSEIRPPARTLTVYANWTANGYRLPTEAEWEKAARGGLSAQWFPWGNAISESQANYKAYPNPPNSGGWTFDLGPYTGFNTNFDAGGEPYTSPVGYFPANGYGLNDMAGNVSEWCWDWFVSIPPYPAGSPYFGGTDPTGPSAGVSRVVRGGDWSHEANFAGCASRNGYGPADYEYYVGFRCVRGL